MRKRTEQFKFLFPLTAMRPEGIVVSPIHVADLEVHYTGYQWTEFRGTDDEFDVDLNKVLLLGKEGEPVCDLVCLLDTIPMDSLRQEVMAAAVNNVGFAFGELDQATEDYEGEIAMEEQRLNG